MHDGVATPRRGAGRPTREQAEARHEELLDTALDLFLERGFELATIEMIAGRVNMTKRTVYARYPDKAALFRAAVQRAIERQIAPRALLESLDNGDLAETLEAIARLRIAQVATPNGLRLQRIINTESYRFPEIFTASFEQSGRPVIEFVAGVIERAVAAGTIAPTNPALAASVFMSMLVSGPVRTIVSGHTPTDYELDERIQFSVRLLLDGLLPRQDVSRPSVTPETTGGSP
ncbi:TetR family transcriptional regulator [Parafrankia colletiae]|uniref:TetR family transcriptional regulator n=1 Tax=Parafrankia colletiae TaxID=573497 RepID=A0A1S1Q3A1_9ACTN|nr:TetR/AcrR family transcriptional regulator [Parafrankia colletiae]MCK9904599.1 TetR/AcrR family transcriptional regulator [Frankia sp. Cpl3]OHV27665.1 TetR family transcriptional regulator [Parafrankia colletiae]